MNRAAAYLSLAAFAALPLLLLAIRRARPERLSWKLLAALLLSGSWLAANAAAYFHFEALGDEIRAHPFPPPRQLVERWQADGATRVFALYLGWLYGGLYAAPFFLADALFARFRRRAER